MFFVFRKVCFLYDVGLFGLFDKMDSFLKWMNEIKLIFFFFSYLGEEVFRIMWFIIVFL